MASKKKESLDPVQRAVAESRAGGVKTPRPAAEPEPEVQQEPHEINSSLSSDRMRALLEDHRKMGSRPKK